MSNLLGFNSVKSTLLASYQNHKLPHAILLLGKKGIGKASFAREFALEITRSEPDILLIEKEAEKREINVEKIRGIRDFANQTAAISKRIIDILFTVKSHCLKKSHENKTSSNITLINTTIDHRIRQRVRYRSNRHN